MYTTIDIKIVLKMKEINKSHRKSTLSKQKTNAEISFAFIGREIALGDYICTIVKRLKSDTYATS